MLKARKFKLNPLAQKFLRKLLIVNLLSILISYKKACLIKDSPRYKNFGTEFNRIKIVTPKALQTETNKNKYFEK